MRKGLKLALSGALCSATLATAVPEEAIAGPMSAPDRSIVAPSSPVENVWYRRGWGYRGGWGRRYGYRRGYYNPGGAIAAGVGLGLLGAGLAAASSGYGGYGYPYGYGYYPAAYSGWGDPWGGWVIAIAIG
ncbi:hypothetical protein C5688_18390, partial [Methylocystis sp. MitZ-2018]